MPTKNFPAYLFLGEEDFLKEEAVEKLKSGFLDPKTSDLNYSIFYGREKNFELSQMLDSLNTLPFLSKRRLCVLKDADSLHADGKRSILFYLRNPKQSSIFVIESPSPVIKGEFLLEVSRSAHLVYHRRLRDPAIDTWLIKKAGLSGKKISKEAIGTIKESLPNHLRVLFSNMDNVILYVGKRSLIARQDVEKVIGVSPSHTTFDLINSLEKKDAKKALRIFSSLKRDRKKETELLGLMAWNARMILRVKELLKIKDRREMQRDLGLSPRSFEQIVRHASGFRTDQISGLLNEILKADLDIKTGTSPRAVIEGLILRICS
ncbi:MAG: DNA polymerase III subunit delta [Candidatus Omnitrophota bacterium]